MFPHPKLHLFSRAAPVVKLTSHGHQPEESRGHLPGLGSTDMSTWIEAISQSNHKTKERTENTKVFRSSPWGLDVCTLENEFEDVYGRSLKTVDLEQINASPLAYQFSKEFDEPSFPQTSSSPTSSLSSTQTLLSLSNSNLSTPLNKILSQSNHPTESGACSSCGAIKPTGWLSFLEPCLHPICMTCINSLINMSCNDPPPLSTNCFICGQVVESFKAPFGINVLSPSSDNGKIPKDPIQPVDFTDHLASITGNSGQNLENGSWFPSSFKNEKSKLTTRNLVSYHEHGPAPIFCDTWPVVRVDNIAWGQTIEGISRWLPSLDVLPPSNLCPLPIHILCNAADGKTLNYCFIETRDIASAHLLVRQRQATKIDSRPCSVGLTSLKELHANLSSSFPRGVIVTAEDLLRLCDTSVIKTLKAPERPFLHLVSIVLQYPSICENNFLPGQGDEDPEEALARRRIREIYLLAIQDLLRAHSWVPNHSKIVKIMLEAGFFSTRSHDHSLFTKTPSQLTRSSFA